MRYAVYDDAKGGFRQIYNGGDGWGRDRGVGAIACADVDGDRRDELVVGRNAGKGMRWLVVDDARAGFRGLHSDSLGGRSRGVAAIACGDLDGDGRAEIVLGRNAGDNMRYAIQDDARARFKRLHSGGDGWGDSRGVSALACGDVDGDGRAEIRDRAQPWRQPALLGAGRRARRLPGAALQRRLVGIQSRRRCAGDRERRPRSRHGAHRWPDPQEHVLADRGPRPRRQLAPRRGRRREPSGVHVPSRLRGARRRHHKRASGPSRRVSTCAGCSSR